MCSIASALIFSNKIMDLCLNISNVQFVYLNGKVAGFLNIFKGQTEDMLGILKFTFWKSRDMADK